MAAIGIKKYPLKSIKLPFLISVLILLICIALVTIAGLSLPTNHDETQYLLAAYFIDRSIIYEDFFYSQTPYFPELLNPWLKVAGAFSFHPYISARAFNVTWSVVFIVSTYFALLSVSRSAFLASTLTLLVVTSKFLDVPLRVVRNDMMPLGLSTIALLLVIKAAKSKDRRFIWIYHFVTGLLLSAATGTKQSFAFLAVAFAIYALIAPVKKFRDRLSDMFVPLVVGGLLGAVPMLLIINPNWENFFYSNFTFHRSVHAIYEMGAVPSIRQRLTTLVDVTHNDWSAFFICAIGLTTVLLMGPLRTTFHRLAQSAEFPIFLLSIVSVVLVLLSCLFIAPMQPQYVGPILPFLACIVAILGGLANASPIYQRSIARHKVFTAFVATVLILHLTIGYFIYERGILGHMRTMLSVGSPGATIYYHRAIGQKKWAAAHFKDVRSQIYAVLGAPNEQIKIATLMSQYAIDAGYGVYPEFSSAPFFYQANDNLDLTELRRMRGTSPDRVEVWLSDNNVQAVLLGYHAIRHEMESGIYKYAKSKRFFCFDIDLTGAYGTSQAKLYVDKSLAVRSPDC